MGNGFSFTVRGNNATLSYTDPGGTHTAGIRVKTLNYNYGVTSTESHARDERAFYPHLRVQGMFSMTPDCLGYKEFRQLMTWLKNYSATYLNISSTTGANGVSLMDVQMPSRNFHRQGMITSGIDDHDQIGSMVFNPELIFVSANDPNDPTVSLTATRSTFISPKVDATASESFYPVTAVNYVDKAIFDDPGYIDSNAAVQAVLTPPPLLGAGAASPKNPAEGLGSTSSSILGAGAASPKNPAQGI